MATKKTEAASPTVLSPVEARDQEAKYRAGVDISLYELADLFERDGYDWRQALRDCGYEDADVSEQVDNATPPEQPEEETALNSEPGPGQPGGPEA